MSYYSLKSNKIIIFDWDDTLCPTTVLTNSVFNQITPHMESISNIINDEKNINLASQCIKNWPYNSKNYSLKEIMSKGKSYTVLNSIKIEKNGNDIFLSNGKDKVLIPNKYIEISKFILDHELFFEEDILNNFKHLPKELILECITNLHKMKVIT